MLRCAGLLLSGVFGVCFLLTGCNANGDRTQPPHPATVLPVPNQLDLNHPMIFGARDGKPVVVACSERIVEIPFVHQHLPYPFRGRLLDVGYRESEIVFQADSLGFDTWGIDIRPAPLQFGGIHFIQGDIINYPFDPKSFDVVIGLSTFEHIGLIFYGNSVKDEEGDLHAVQAVHRILKPTGRFLLTVPFGKQGATNWYRVYDHAALEGLLLKAGFRIEIENYWTKQENLHWVPTPWREAEQVDSVSKVRGVACVVARPLP
jgi:SAM-dependent methyltransferase